MRSFIIWWLHSVGMLVAIGSGLLGLVIVLAALIYAPYHLHEIEYHWCAYLIAAFELSVIAAFITWDGR